MTLILVTSLEAHARDKALDAMVRTWPHATVIRHDLLEGERVLRRISKSFLTLERSEIPLEHGCLTCTVRLDVVPTVMRLLDEVSGDMIIGLPPSVSAAMAMELLEPRLLSRGIVVNSICLAVDPAALEDQMWDSRTLWQAGLSSVRGDDRTSGEFLVHEIAYADTALLVEGLFAHLFEAQAPGCQSGGELFQRGTRLLGHLGPHLKVLHPERDIILGSHLAAAARRRAAAGNPCVDSTGHAAKESRTSAVEKDFTTVELRAERPLHPARLLDAMHHLAEGCIWLRGTLWIANSPSLKMVFGGAGPFVWIEGRGLWKTETARTHLALTSDSNNESELTEMLRQCELTDAEMLQSTEIFEDVLKLGDLA